jgi:hypothetical protein
MDGSRSLWQYGVSHRRTLAAHFGVPTQLEPHFDKLLETLRTGRRKQDTLISNKYRYYKRFDELLPDNNHLVLIVVFQTRLNAQGQYVPNNFVVTGWANYIWSQG